MTAIHAPAQPRSQAVQAGSDPWQRFGAPGTPSQNAPAFENFLRILAQASTDAAQSSLIPGGAAELPPRATPHANDARTTGAEHDAASERRNSTPPHASAALGPPDLDDLAAKELATPTPRTPDPLGLSEAVRQDMTAPEQKAPEPRGRGPSLREASEAPPGSERPGRPPDHAPSRDQGAQSASGQSANPASQAGPARRSSHASSDAGAVKAAGAASITGPRAVPGAAPPAPLSGAIAPAGATRGVPGLNTVGGVGASVRREALIARKIDAPSAPAPSRAAGEPAALQASRAIAAALRTGEKSLTLRMTPEHLGEVRVELSVKDGSVSASFQASSESARDLLVDSSDALRTALEARGLHVEKMEFAVTEHGVPPPGADAPWSEAGFGGAGAGSGGAAQEDAARSARRAGTRSAPDGLPDESTELSAGSTSERRSWLALGIDAVA